MRTPSDSSDVASPTSVSITSAAAEEILIRPATRLRVRASVPPAVRSRDALARDQTLQHQLASGDRHRGVALRSEPDVLDDVGQTGKDGQRLEHGLGAGVGLELERSALVEPHHDVIDVDAP